MDRNEFIKAMNEVNVRALRPSGYELFVWTCARKVFQHEQEEGQEDADVSAFIEELGHDNESDIWEAYMELKSDYHRANVYPSPVERVALSEREFKNKWSMGL